MTPRLTRCLAIATACAALFGSAKATAQATPGARPRSTATPGATQPSTPATHPIASAAAIVAGVVNINAADEEELQRLPGIGPARATAIVALRQRVQHFRSADDLLRVRGIGHAGMRRLRPYITLAGATTLTARPARLTASRTPTAAASASQGGR